MTLHYLHQGHITTAYARSSFLNYQSRLQNVEQQLPTQEDAPDTSIMEGLLKLYRRAMQAINHPCLDSSCHWHVQIVVLDRASQAFLKVSEQ